jgi:hypothetical protein
MHREVDSTEFFNSISKYSSQFGFEIERLPYEYTMIEEYRSYGDVIGYTVQTDEIHYFLWSIIPCTEK